MAYFEYVCVSCGVYFECIIDDDDRGKTICVDCKSPKLQLVGYSELVPTQVETLQKVITKLENRIDKLIRKLGLDPNDIEGEKKDRFTYRN